MAVTHDDEVEALFFDLFTGKDLQSICLARLFPAVMFFVRVITTPARGAGGESDPDIWVEQTPGYVGEARAEDLFQDFVAGIVERFPIPMRDIDLPSADRPLHIPRIDRCPDLLLKEVSMSKIVVPHEIFYRNASIGEGCKGTEGADEVAGHNGTVVEPEIEEISYDPESLGVPGTDVVEKSDEKLLPFTRFLLGTEAEMEVREEEMHGTNIESKLDYSFLYPIRAVILAPLSSRKTGTSGSN